MQNKLQHFELRRKEALPHVIGNPVRTALAGAFEENWTIISCIAVHAYQRSYCKIKRLAVS